VLVVDDDRPYATLLGELLEAEGVTTDLAESWSAMEERLAARGYALVVLDMRLPDCLALDRLEELVPRLPRTPVLIATALNDVVASVEAMRRGASGYVTKGIDCDRIVAEILRHLPPVPTARRDEGERASALAVARELDWVTESPVLIRAIGEARRFALADAPVVVVGEAGTGKDGFATALHRLSPRRDEPLLVVDCGTEPEPILEAQLFGPSEGRRSSGATAEAEGALLAAGAGTLVLDHVTELPPRLQRRLVRLLRDRRAPTPDDRTPRSVRARIVATTRRGLEGAVREGVLRDDLRRALAVLRLDVPALRERGADIGPLVRQRIDRNNARFGRRTRYPGPDVMARLVAHRWDGNVRELHAVVDRATTLAGDAAIELRHLLLDFPTADAPAAPLTRKRSGCSKRSI
jgi:DNA-binding NtrC family response regulator